MTPLKRAGVWTVSVAAAALVAAIAAPGRRGAVVSAAIIAILAEAMLELTRVARPSAAPTAPDWDRFRSPASPGHIRPSDLQRLERALGWGRYSAADFNYQVRPVLRGLLVSRLRERHGVDLDAQPPPARPALSPELCETVVLRREPTDGRVIQTRDVERLVTEIEAL